MGKIRVERKGRDATVQLGTRVPAELLTAAKVHAAKRGTTIQNLVIAGLRAAIDHGRVAPRTAV